MTPEPVSIVTAASKGIGAACARKLSQDGNQVVVMSRSEAGKSIAEEVGGRWIEGDITRVEDIDRVVAETFERGAMPAGGAF